MKEHPERPIGKYQRAFRKLLKTKGSRTSQQETEIILLRERRGRDDSFMDNHA